VERGKDKQMRGGRLTFQSRSEMLEKGKIPRRTGHTDYLYERQIRRPGRVSAATGERKKRITFWSAGAKAKRGSARSTNAGEG